MKSSSLLSLVAALVIVSGLGFWLLQDDMQQTETSTSLLGEFEQQLAAVTKVDISDANGQLLVAELLEGEWVATHMESGLQFPADKNVLVGLIASLSEAAFYQPKTQNPENYARLAVEDVTSEDAQSRLLTLYAGDKAFSVLVGNTATSGVGSFVRFPEQAQSWLIDRRLDLPIDAQQWLLNPLALMNVEQVTTAFRQGEGAWQASREASSENGDTPRLIMTELTAEESYQFPNVVENSLSAMLTARFDAVRPLTSVELADAPNASVTFTSQDNELSILLYGTEAQYYAVYVSAGHPWLSDWVFELSSFAYNQLDKQRSDFVEVPEAEGPPAPAEQVPIDEGEAPGGD